MFFFQNYDTKQYIEHYVYRNMKQTNQIREAKEKKDFLKKIEEGEVELTEKVWEYILKTD